MIGRVGLNPTKWASRTPHFTSLQNVHILRPFWLFLQMSNVHSHLFCAEYYSAKGRPSCWKSCCAISGCVTFCRYSPWKRRRICYSNLNAERRSALDVFYWNTSMLQLLEFPDPKHQRCSLGLKLGRNVSACLIYIPPWILITALPVDDPYQPERTLSIPAGWIILSLTLLVIISYSGSWYVFLNVKSG
jgi:hypothetical protein